MKTVSEETLNPAWISERKLNLSRGSEGPKTGHPLDFKSYLMFIHHLSESGSVWAANPVKQVVMVLLPHWDSWGPQDRNREETSEEFQTDFIELMPQHKRGNTEDRKVL